MPALVVAHPHESLLDDMVAELRPLLSELGHITTESKREFERGLYTCLYLKPAKRLATSLETNREILIVVTTFNDLQQRTVKFSKDVIVASKGRLDSGIVVVAHQDAKGDGSLREWGRELALMVLPVFMDGEFRRGGGLERLFSRELFAHDPFDLAGPIRGEGQFFGRSDVNDIARRLQQGQVKAFFGIRKIGKTSMLNQIIEHCRGAFDSACIVADCQNDALCSLQAPQLLDAITGAVIEALVDEGDRYRAVVALSADRSLGEAMRDLQYNLGKADRAVVLILDEVDFVTPGSPTYEHWGRDFNIFFRALRTIYQETCRTAVNFSVVLSGVSSKWFFAESIEGVENSALAFVPEEYLGPFKRAQSVNMIKTLGKSAGLLFADSAADDIAATCADIPFWIRKAGSHIHRHFDTDDRPVNVNRGQAGDLMDSFARSDGWVLAEVSLRHLFRVFPELLPVAAQQLAGGGNRSKNERRYLTALGNYGVLDAQHRVRGPLMRAGIEALIEEAELTSAQSPIRAESQTETDAWADRLAYLARERGLLERRLRGFIVQVLRTRRALRPDGRTPKELLLSAIPEARRNALEKYRVDDLVERLFWLDLVQIVKRNWDAFAPYFGDKPKFEQHCDIVNDRPDAHAKELDDADLAMYRRSIRALNELMDKLD